MWFFYHQRFFDNKELYRIKNHKRILRQTLPQAAPGILPCGTAMRGWPFTSFRFASA
jgi:hypothetical protein